jgi:hypothetical protein
VVVRGDIVADRRHVLKGLAESKAATAAVVPVLD